MTSGPGLAGALLVGVAAAKSLAVALGKPIYGVNHLAAHVCVDQLEHGPLDEPSVAMLVSGGHSSLLLVPDITEDVIQLGQTIDDAAGEAFDKIARVLGLPFPGGPYIDKAAQSGNPNAIDFPRGLTTPKDMAKHRFDVSFSGLKTAVARWIETEQRAGNSVMVNDVAASFQRAVVDVLVHKARRAARQINARTIALGGGVAANSLLRREMTLAGNTDGMEVVLPSREMCTDNAAMIASAGWYCLRRGEVSTLDAGANPNLKLGAGQR